MSERKALSEQDIEEIVGHTIPKHFGNPLIACTKHKLRLSKPELSEPESQQLFDEIEHSVTAIFGPIMAKRVVHDLKSYFEPLAVHEIYLIDNSGCLINHVSNRDDWGIDDHLLSSMFTAIQDFVRVSFTNQDDQALKKMRIGDEKVFISQGKNAYLTVIYSGHMDEDGQTFFNHVLADLEEQYEFEAWGGEVQRFDGIEERIRSLLSRSSHS